MKGEIKMPRYQVRTTEDDTLLYSGNDDHPFMLFARFVNVRYGLTLFELLNTNIHMVDEYYVKSGKTRFDVRDLTIQMLRRLVNEAQDERARLLLAKIIGQTVSLETMELNR
jgi:hypothetical protein